MEREFDISKYKPYKDYRGLCRFKSLKEKKMSWPAMEKYVLDGKYRLRPLREDEIDEIVEIYRTGYPELFGNTHYEFVLWSETLIKVLNTENGFMEGDWFLNALENVDEKKLVGALLINMDKGNMSVHWQSGVIHPDYRGAKGLFMAMCEYNDEFCEKAGAEYGYMTANTFHIKTQIVLKELGWKIRGIFPGNVCMWNHKDEYYRHSVVFFDKFFNEGEKLVPKEIDLIPEAKKIYKLYEEIE
ncbi:MAG: hypothetical protein OIN88_02300 [Candidatus Methanoperedens sp.]|nr:hypothetical protein [Candidatus Methanoperedens sp.]